MPNQRPRPEMPLSARFSPTELRLLRDAAETKGWSVARVIRTGALEKAAHAVNAARRGPALSRFLAHLIRQLRDPDISLKDDPETTERRVVRLSEFIRAQSEDGDQEADVVQPEAAQWQRLLQCVRALGAELAPFLEAALPASPDREGEAFDTLIDPRSVVTPDRPPRR